MNEEAIKDAYSLFVGTGYKKSYEEFKQLMASNPEALNDVYGLFVGTGYKKDINSFKTLMGADGGMVQPQEEELKKKEESVTMDSPSGASSLASQRQFDFSKIAQPQTENEKLGIKQVKDIDFAAIKEKTRQEETQKAESPFYKSSLETITPDLIDRSEEYVVPQMNYQFGPMGFKFEEYAPGDDYMRVVGPGGEEHIVNLIAGAYNKEEADKLKRFIEQNTRASGLKSLERQYAEENKKFSTDEEVDTAFKALDTDAVTLKNDITGFLQERQQLDSERTALDAVPFDKRNNPEYRQKQDLYTQKAMSLDKRMQSLSSREEQIKSDAAKLEKSVGKYTSMKSEQGGWVGGLRDAFMVGIGRMASGTVNAVVDAAFSKYTSGVDEDEISKSISDSKATGNALQDAKDGGVALSNAYRINEVYNKAIEDERAKGVDERAMTVPIGTPKPIPMPTAGQSYKDWWNSLSSDQKTAIADKSNDDIKKDLKVNLLPAMRTGAEIVLGDPNTTVQWAELKKQGFWGGAILGVAESLPAMIGSNTPIGWAQRTASMYAQTSDAVYEEMSKNPAFDDISESEKLSVVAPIGIASAALESMGLRNVVANKGLMNRIILGAIGKAGATTTAKTFGELVKNEVDSMVARGLLTAGGAMLAEAETGAVQQISEYAFKEIYNAAKGKDMFQTPDFLSAEYIKDVAVSGAQEAVGGFVLGVPSAVSAAYSKKGFLSMDDKQFEFFRQAANDSKIEQAYVVNLKQKAATGEITIKQAKEALNDYRNSVGLYRSVPEELSTQDAKEAMNLLKEKKSLEQQIEGKDEALVKRQKTRITQINESLNKLSENAIQESSTEEVLPREQGETTETGGERGQMGQGVQGQETTQAGAQEKVGVLSSPETITVALEQLPTEERMSITFMQEDGTETPVMGNEKMLASLYDVASQLSEQDRTEQQQSVVDAVDVSLKTQLNKEAEGARLEQLISEGQTPLEGDEWVNELEDEKVYTFEAPNMDEVPEQFRGTAEVVPAREATVRKKFLGLIPYGKAETRAIGKEFVRYKATGAEARAAYFKALESGQEVRVDFRSEEIIDKGIQSVRDTASEYIKMKKSESKDNEFKTRTETGLVKRLSSSVSKMIASAYEDVKDLGSEEKVKKAYDAMIAETNQQYNFLVSKGLKVERYNGKGEPYKNSQEMVDDIRNNNHLFFLPNDEAFGENPELAKGNIGLQKSGIKLDDGYEMTNSEVFRVVHDYFGHGALGNEFGPVGEENATLQHVRMYSNTAIPAVVYQTRGQNSWVNFSGANQESKALFAEAKRLRAEGKTQEAEVVAEEGRKKFKFAEPKIGLFPNVFNFTKYETARRLEEQQSIDRRGDVTDSRVSNILPTIPKEVRTTRGVTKRSVRGTESIRGNDVEVIATYELDDSSLAKIRAAFPAFVSLQKIYEIKDGELYRKLMIEALKDNTFKSSVTIHSAEDFGKMRLFITEDGSTGITLTEEGFLGGAFSDPNFKRPNDLAQLMILGIKEGGTTAEAFDTVLPDYYSMYGFKAVSRTAFNDEFRPTVANGALEDWDYKKYSKYNGGRPDVVFMIYDGGDRGTIENRIGQFDSYNDYEKENTESFGKDDYDAAYAVMNREAVKRFLYEKEAPKPTAATKNTKALIARMSKAFPGVAVYVDQEMFDNVMKSDKVRKFVKDGQVIYGVTVDGDIYINPEVHDNESALFNTSIHEFGHVWSNFLRTTARGKELYTKGVSLIEEAAKTDEKIKKMYAEQLGKFGGDKKRALNEMVSILIGNKGEEIVSQTLKQRFRNWLNAVFTYIKNEFKLSKDLTSEQIQNMTLDQFIGTGLADLLSGERLTVSESQALKLKNPEVAFSSSQSAQSIVKMARANGFSEEAIRTALERREFTAEQIEKALAEELGAAARVTLSEQVLEGYDRMMSQIEGIIQKSKRRGASEGKIASNVMSYMTSSAVYERATDVQREKLVRDINTKFGINMKSAPSPDKLFGTVKDVKKITLTERELLKKQIKDLSRGAKDAKVAWMRTSNELTTAVKELAKSGKISSKQVVSVLRRFSKVNMFSQDSVDRFVDYMVNVFEDANYAENIENVRRLIPTAKRNLKTKVGVANEIVPNLQKLFAINPILIPQSVFAEYVKLVDSFGQRQAVLTLPEVGDVSDVTAEILDAVNEEVSIAEEMAERFDYYENKVYKDDKLMYSETITKMLEEEVISAKEADIMRKYKSIILPRVEKPQMTEQEIQEEKSRIVNGIMQLSVDSELLASRDERDLAEKLSKLLVPSLLKKLSIPQINNIAKLIDNINNGYLPHYAQLSVERLNALKNSEDLNKAVESAKPLAFSKIYANLKSKFTGKGATLEMIRRSPLYFIDQVFGDFKTKTIFNSLFKSIAEGQSLFDSAIGRVNKKLDLAHDAVAKSYGYNANDTLLSSFKMMTYMLQLEHSSNPDSKQVNPAAKYLNATIKHINKGLSRYGEKDAEMLQSILDDYSTDGEIDNERLYASFNKAEKAAIKEVQELNSSLTEKAAYTAAVIRGQRIDPLVNYIHLPVLHDYNPDEQATSTQSAADYNNGIRPSTRARNLIARTGQVSPINFDIFASAQRGAKFTLLDYYLTEPIRTARKTISEAEIAQEQGGATNEQKRTLNAISQSLEEVVSNVLTNNFVADSFADEVVNFISKQGYRAILASVPRFISELSSNIGFALIVDPKSFNEGVKYRSVVMSPLAISVMDNVKSKQTTRLFHGDTLSGRFIDSSILSQSSGVKSSTAKNSVSNIANMIYNMSLKKYKNFVELTADALISTPDKMVMRPIWFGAFATEFKRQTGKEVDFDKIGQDNEQYMSEYAEAIEASKTYADDKSVTAGATDNAFMGVLKGTTKPNQSVLLRAFNNFNNFMTRFAIYEYTTARQGIYAAMGNGSITRKQGVAMLAGVTTRMTTYTLLSSMLGGAMLSLFADEEEDDEKTFMQKFGQSLASSVTGLMFGRDFGNATKSMISYGVEEMNDKFLTELRNGDYDPYKDAISFSVIPKERKGQNTNLTDFITQMGGSFGPVLKTTDLIARKAFESPKKQAEAIGRSSQEKEVRIPLEVLGNLGFVPLYKDLRKVVMSQMYKDLETADKKAADKKQAEKEMLRGYENKTDMKRYDPELYEEVFGEKSPGYDEAEAKRRIKKEKEDLERKMKDEFYDYVPSKKDKSGFGSKEFGSKKKKSSDGFGSKEFGK